MEKKNVKVCILGSMNTGKTTLITSLNGGNIETLESTIGVAFHQLKREVEGDTITLNVWDTAGQERYEALIPMYYRNCHIAIIVFDITDPSTYNKMIENYRRLSPSCHKIIVGNKLDLVRDKEILNQFDNLTYQIVYTSAIKKTNFHVLLNRIDECLGKIDFSTDKETVQLLENNDNWNCCNY